MRRKQTNEHKLLHFSLKAFLNTILRMENIGQIYHKYKIREILSWDMTKVPEEQFKKKTPKLV